MWSLESIANITLDRRLGIVSGKNDETADNLIKLIREFLVEAFKFEVEASVWKYFETKTFKNLMRIYDDLTNIVLHYVEKSIQDIESRAARIDTREESILEKLLKINKNLAIVMATDALFAGVDTTSSSVISTLYCLAKNQDKQDKLREELRSVLKNKDDELKEKNMQNMPYLRACIKEVLRIYPPAIGTVRRTVDDIVLSGYRIPKGTEVLMPFVIHAKDCHSQPNEFIPERFLREPVPGCPHSKEATPFSYMPFGFGSRICIGRRLANLEMEVLITRLIRDYKIEWNYDELKFKIAVIAIPDGDLKFKITKVP